MSFARVVGRQFLNNRYRYLAKTFFSSRCAIRILIFVLRTVNSGARVQRSVGLPAGKTGARDHNNRRNFPTSRSLLLRRIVTGAAKVETTAKRDYIIPVRTPDVTAILPFVSRPRRHSSSSSFTIVVVTCATHTMVL